MSIAIMTRVWSESQHKGSELLLLLAIADNANDQGIAYPSVRTLAKKTRLHPHHVKKLLRVLEASGELVTHIGTGPRGCNEYQIKLSTEEGSNLLPRMKSTGSPQDQKGVVRGLPEPNTKPKREEKPFSLSRDDGPTGPEGKRVTLNPADLKRLGLTPGSTVWNALVEGDQS
jgi:DNA-binding MarR family transcriptional regulator